MKFTQNQHINVLLALAMGHFLASSMAMAAEPPGLPDGTGNLTGKVVIAAEKTEIAGAELVEVGASDLCTMIASGKLGMQGLPLTAEKYTQSVSAGDEMLLRQPSAPDLSRGERLALLLLLLEIAGR